MLICRSFRRTLRAVMARSTFSHPTSTVASSPILVSLPMPELSLYSEVGFVSLNLDGGEGDEGTTSGGDEMSRVLFLFTQDNISLSCHHCSPCWT